jgi:tRNA 2-selenouridine synthase
MQRDKIPPSRIGEFDCIIDVRTSEEFALDHLPGAINLPVLNEAERHRVGYTYKQTSPFPAKRMGAALILRHIADMLDNEFADKPKDWAPLIYCWRGGKRSGTLTHLLNEVGWPALTLEGGYQAYRRHVTASLETLPQTLNYRVLVGQTGAGKTRLLNALAEQGAQVLDLEGLAKHRGSLLGEWDEPQPSQKYFDTLVWQALQSFDPARPVYVESESKKIGILQVPEVLLTCMRASDCVQINTSDQARVVFLLEEYQSLLANTEYFATKVTPLIPLQGHEVVGRWINLSREGRISELILDLLHNHYDPAYQRSIGKNFTAVAQAKPIALNEASPEAIASAAHHILQIS